LTAPAHETTGGGAVPPDAARPPAEAKMTIWEHLEELRRRIIRAAIGVLSSTIVAWNFRERLLAELVKPYQRTWLEHFHKPLVLQTLAPADAFLGYFELSLTAGLVASAPIIFYQLWAFISPGLYKKEKRLIVPFVLFSTTLFLSGVAFAYCIAFPFTFNYFMSLLGPISEGVELTQIVTLEFFLDFATRFLLGFGAVFELPLFIAFLVLAKIVTPKQLLKFGRWATVLAFVVGAIVTPGPEVTSQLSVSLALVALYFLSIPIAYLLSPRAPAEGGTGSGPAPGSGPAAG
jgi:sec-independent protein translocase protein TatC